MGGSALAPLSRIARLRSSCCSRRAPWKADGAAVISRTLGKTSGCQWITASPAGRFGSSRKPQPPLLGRVALVLLAPRKAARVAAQTVVVTAIFRVTAQKLPRELLPLQATQCVFGFRRSPVGRLGHTRLLIRAELPLHPGCFRFSVFSGSPQNRAARCLLQPEEVSRFSARETGEARDSLSSSSSERAPDGFGGQDGRVRGHDPDPGRR